MSWDWEAITDGLGLIFILAGAVLCLTAAIGLLRFRDLLTRMHAATKPQVLGVLLVLVGVMLSKEGGLHIGMLILIAIFQMLTIPVGAHMVGRAGFRTGQVAPSDIHLGPSADHADRALLQPGRRQDRDSEGDDGDSPLDGESAAAREEDKAAPLEGTDADSPEPDNRFDTEGGGTHPRT